MRLKPGTEFLDWSKTENYRKVVNYASNYSENYRNYFMNDVIKRPWVYTKTVYLLNCVSAFSVQMLLPIILFDLSSNFHNQNLFGEKI